MIIFIDQSAFSQLSLNVSITNPVCNGTSTGSVTVSPSGGTAPYDLTITNSNGNTINIPGIFIVNSLSTGWYYITVLDFVGNTILDSVELIDSPQIDIMSTVVQLDDCACDGSITIDSVLNAQGGGVSAFLWTPNQNTPVNQSNLTDLCSGAYNLQIIDNQGCVNSFQFYLNNPSGTSFIASNPNCYGSTTGSISVFSSNGPSVNYTITDNNGAILNTNGANSVNNLGGGWYYASYTFASCTYVDSIELIEPLLIDVIATVTQPSGPAACDGAISVDTVYGWQGSYGLIDYTWNPNPNGNNGWLEDSIGDLCNGIYTLDIFENFGCNYTFTYNLGGLDFKSESGPQLTVFKTNHLLNVNNPSGDTFQISIYNSIGQIIQTHLIIPGDNQVLLKSSAGLTIYTIQSGNKFIKKGKI